MPSIYMLIGLANHFCVECLKQHTHTCQHFSLEFIFQCTAIFSLVNLDSTNIHYLSLHITYFLFSAFIDSVSFLNLNIM